MYQCEICRKVVPPNTPSYKIVVETRPVAYPRRPDANKTRVRGKIEKRDDPGGQGFEIVRELRACPECANRTR